MRNHHGARIQENKCPKVPSASKSGCGTQNIDKPRQLVHFFPLVEGCRSKYIQFMLTDGPNLKFQLTCFIMIMDGWSMLGPAEMVL